MQRRGLPWHEARSKLVKKSISLNEMKEWRAREAEAGRPSSFADLCRAFGLCVNCLGEGVTYNDNGVGFKVVGIDGDTRLFERCPVCGGTGMLQDSGTQNPTPGQNVQCPVFVSHPATRQLSRFARRMISASRGIGHERSIPQFHL